MSQERKQTKSEIGKQTKSEIVSTSLLTGEEFKEILQNPTKEGLRKIGNTIEAMRKPASLSRTRRRAMADPDLLPLVNLAQLLNYTTISVRRNRSFISVGKELGQMLDKLKSARSQAGLVFKGKIGGYKESLVFRRIEVPYYTLDLRGDLELVPTIYINLYTEQVDIFIENLVPVNSPDDIYVDTASGWM